MRKLLNELSPELRNRAARKATLDSDKGNIQGLTAAKRKIQASKFLELPSQLKNFADRICDKMQEYFTGMEIHSYKDNKTKFDIGKVRVYTFEKFIDTNSYSTHIDLLIVIYHVQLHYTNYYRWVHIFLLFALHKVLQSLI